MSYSKHKLIHDAYKGSDLLSLLLALTITLSWYASSYALGFSMLELFSMRLKLVNFVAFLVLALLYLTVFQKAGLYTPTRIKRGFINTAYAVGKAVGFNVIIFAAASRLFDFSLFSPVFLLAFWPTATILTVLMRRLMRFVLTRINLGDKNERRVVILGTNDTARDYADMVDAEKALGYELVGCLDDELLNEGLRGRWLGALGDFPRLASQEVIDEVVVAMPISRYSEPVKQLIKHAYAKGILVRFPMSQLFGPLFQGETPGRIQCAQSMISPWGGTIPELVMHSGFHVGWRFLVKRVLDLSLAATLVVLTAPIMLLAALAIRINSPGPVFFVQERYGYNGRVFRLYKFRTMVQDAHKMQAQLREAHNEMDGAAFKMRNDPRVTPVGRFLRKTSIDELPQLLNVIKGDISLVGPRPLPVSDYEQLTELSHLRRLSVLPGITCHWQASGRNNLSFEEWMALDMEYIDNWRLWTDVKILLQTIPAVFRGTGAS